MSEQGGHRAMRKGPDGEGFRSAEAGQQVIGLAEVGHHLMPGFPLMRRDWTMRQ